jgi:hypothetical protein
MPLSASGNIHAVAENTIEINVKGKWVRVPALNVNGATLIIRKGRNDERRIIGTIDTEAPARAEPEPHEGWAKKI